MVAAVVVAMGVRAQDGLASEILPAVDSAAQAAVSPSAAAKIESTRAELEGLAQSERDAAELRDLRQQLNWEKKRRWMRGYTNISWALSQKLTYDDGLEIGKANLGAGFTTGRSFIMHKTGIANMVWFGLDATWFDVSYSLYDSYVMRGVNGDKPIDGDLHQVEIGMGVGPSVHVFPLSKLGVHGYFRYNPAFTASFDKDFNLMGGYASTFVAGGAVSWGKISVGLETRWGGGKYSDLTEGAKQSMIDNLEDDLKEDIPGVGVEIDPVKSKASEKRKFSGTRVYIGFRF